MDRENLKSEAREMGAALMSVKDVSLVTGVDIRDDQELYNCYLAGMKETEYKTRKIIIDQAFLGSKPAQDRVFQLLDDLRQEENE